MSLIGFLWKLCQPLVDLFNKSCPNLPKVKELNQSRKDKIKTRLKEHRDFSWWEEVFKKANGISFIGKDGKEWRPSFDWLFENDGNTLKVIEGNYDSKSKGSFKSQPDYYPSPKDVLRDQGFPEEVWRR